MKPSAFASLATTNDNKVAR